MSEINKLLTAVERASNDIDDVKGRVSSILSKLSQVKLSVMTAIPPSQPESANVNTDVLKRELEVARSNILRFKEIIKGAVESGAGKDETNTTSQAEVLKQRKDHDDRSKSLYERVGGDISIEGAVDKMYASALQDSRLRAFFEKNKRKMNMIRKRMQEFVITLFGGPKLYEVENLKSVHYSLNITDWHFEAILELFEKALFVQGVHEDAVRDAIIYLNRIRKDVTTGCTVRSAIATRKAALDKDGLYNRLGGESGLAIFIDRLFSLISADTRFKKSLQNRSIDVWKSGMKIYLSELLGGPNMYKGRDLENIHKSMRIDDYNFDCLVSNVEKVMIGLDFPEFISDELLARIEPIREILLGRKRGLLSKSKLVDGETVLERLGGELNLEAIIETMFQGCAKDPRTRFFFDIPENRLKDWKAKMQQVLVGLCGGAQTYNIKILRENHYNMNIQDFHFDAVVENFQVAAEQMQVPNHVITDFTEILAKVRPELTAGCTVRLELGRIKEESAKNRVENAQTVYDALGGQDAMDGFVKELYESIDKDDRIAHYFRGSKATATKQMQSQFIVNQFGSPVRYTGRSLTTAHAMIQISDYHFETFVEHCIKGLKCVGANDDCVDMAVSILEKSRKIVVSNVLRNYDIRKAIEFANRKPLYDRMGGEAIFSQLINLFYEKLLGDDRVRSFFEKNKAKVQTIKKRMTSFLILLSGGSSDYDASGLRSIHSDMNITDFHFDVTIEVLLITMLKDMEIARHDAQELIRLIQPIRAIVTTGCTVRMEIARRNVEKNKDELFQRVQGSEGVKKIVDCTFDILLVDQRVKQFFTTNTERIKSGICIYVTELLGGPKVYKGRDLGAVHVSLGVTDYHFDTFLNDMQKAINGLGYSEKVVDEVLITLEPIRADVLNRSRDADKTSAKFKDGKLLIDRIGGDMAIESIIEAMYDRAMADSRTKSFFDKSKAKQRQIRSKMYQYISGAFGGPIQYDIKSLRPMHWSMNVTDYHFDTVLECFNEACNDYNVEPDTIDDALSVLNRVRADVCTGCTVRFEIARDQLLNNRRALFEKLGEEFGVSDIIEKSYEQVMADKRINIFFDGSKMAAVKEQQKVLLCGILGGEKKYKGRSMEEIHRVS